ncbi:hypothetical protein F6P94_15260 [Escherichia coli]|nr:hypothetical protein F6P94_15260 [Escherichia coli]
MPVVNRQSQRWLVFQFATPFRQKPESVSTDIRPHPTPNKQFVLPSPTEAAVDLTKLSSCTERMPFEITIYNGIVSIL